MARGMAKGEPVLVRAWTSVSGVFETMRAVDGRVPLLDRHLARLRASAKALGLHWSDDGRLGTQIDQHLAAKGTQRVRLDLLPSGETTVTVGPLPDNRPVRIALVPGYEPGTPPRHKLRDRTHYEHAVTAAHALGADHPLLVSVDGRVGEADHANLFAVIDGRLVTPAPAGILPGIARAMIVERLGAEECGVTITSLESASEMFLTNALRGIIPVTTIDGRPCATGALTREAATVLRSNER